MTIAVNAHDAWITHDAFGVKPEALNNGGKAENAAASTKDDYPNTPPERVRSEADHAKDRNDLRKRLNVPMLVTADGFDKWLLEKGVDPAKAFAYVPYSGPAFGLGEPVQASRNWNHAIEMLGQWLSG